eukprot:CAMPEP_0115093990 /NCGR_PEP_ID=MMETSP0227-20121206/28002_1 /TAXON_ID=89957 /ORGANISM="Polarella glacialis, Strain CCMP 1383" /LENGTH=94 /DNA_ID=CAMNT_0002486729 /DNA_START=1047 /DNA_END=1328 /DNA_ORIENTATION=+
MTLLPPAKLDSSRMWRVKEGPRAGTTDFSLAESPLAPMPAWTDSLNVMPEELRLVVVHFDDAHPGNPGPRTTGGEASEAAKATERSFCFTVSQS